MHIVQTPLPQQFGDIGPENLGTIAAQYHMCAINRQSHNGIVDVSQKVQHVGDHIRRRCFPNDRRLDRQLHTLACLHTRPVPL